MSLLRWFIGCFILLSVSLVHASNFHTLLINHHPFTIEIPETPNEYYQGLMYRSALPESQGMLFFFDEQSVNNVAMWMKHTYIPLDLLFIGPDHRIHCIIENTIPLSVKLLSCNQSTLAVVELNAGEVKKYNIQKDLIVEMPKGIYKNKYY